MQAQKLDLSTLTPGQTVFDSKLGDVIWLGTQGGKVSIVEKPDGTQEKLQLEEIKERFKRSHANLSIKSLGNRLLKLPVLYCEQFYTLGSDPEIFCRRGSGEILPAFEFLPKKPKRGESWDKAEAVKGIDIEVPQVTDFGIAYPAHKTPVRTAVYWDGFQAEIALEKSTHCLQNTVDHIHAGLKHLWLRLQKHDPTARFTIQNTVQVPKEKLLAAELEHVAFGCKPSYNVYGDLGEDLSGTDPRSVTERWSGGHWHFGFEALNIQEVEQGVKALDAILAVVAVSLADGIDNPNRRRYYGLPGEFRLPKHGLEYRVLSNFWLSSPAIANLVWDLGRRVLTFGKRGFLPLWNASEDETKETIKFCAVGHARKILARNKALLLALIPYPSNYMKAAAYATITQGIRNVLEPEDIVRNWKLEGGWQYGSLAEGCRFSSFAKNLGK